MSYGQVWMARALAITAWAATALASADVAAAESELYGVEFGFAPSPLFQIDQTTGHATKAFDTTVFGGGLAFDPLRDVFLATDLYDVREISRATGQITRTFPVAGRDVAYDLFADQMYVSFHRTLDRLDRRTGDFTSLGNLAGGIIQSLAFHPTEERLYAVFKPDDGGLERLIRFNDLSNLADQTVVVTIPWADPNITALAWDDATHSFFASATNSPFRSLMRIDPSTGLSTTIGAFGIGNELFDGLASAPVDVEAWFYSLDRYVAGNLQGMPLYASDLAGWNLAGKTLDGADFSGSRLQDTRLNDANVSGAKFSRTTARGFTAEQLYSTASYRERRLQGMGLDGNDLSRWNFANQDLSGGSVASSTLVETNFTGAVLRGVDFSGANFAGARLDGADVREAKFGNVRGLAPAQFYATASYQNRDLTGVDLGGGDWSGWNFAEQKLEDAKLAGATLADANLSRASLTRADITGATLTRAQLSEANLTAANLTGSALANVNLTRANLTSAVFDSATLAGAALADAQVTGASFSGTTVGGFTKEQFYSTANYQTKDLRGIALASNDLTGWDFSGLDLTGASLGSSTLANADLTGAVVAGARLFDITSRGFTKEQLYSTASYQSGDLHAIDFSGNALTGWDFSGQDLSGARLNATLTNATLHDAVVTGVSFSGATANGFTKEQLYSTANYQAGDLRDIDFSRNNLTGWDFSGQNLAGASFFLTTIANADLTGAHVAGATLVGATTLGFTKEQLYSTASYHEKNLRGIDLGAIPVWFGLLSDLTGWDFSDQDLTGANFWSATLTNANLAGAILINAQFSAHYGGLTSANLTFADARGAQGLTPATTLSRNAILADGKIAGLELAAGERLIVRDDDGVSDASPSGRVPPRLPIPITIESGLSMPEGSVLQLLFEADPWDSLISFEPGVPVQVGGALELVFADGVDVASQVGRTLRLFDWDGVAPNGQFGIRSPYAWNVDKLYATGEVTLVAVPEPSPAAMALAGAAMLAARSSAIFRRRPS